MASPEAIQTTVHPSAPPRACEPHAPLTGLQIEGRPSVGGDLVDRKERLEADERNGACRLVRCAWYVMYTCAVHAAAAAYGTNGMLRGDTAEAL